jgi:hypothetical protein
VLACVHPERRCSHHPPTHPPTHAPHPCNAAARRAKQLQPDEYNSGTFTVSNLGMYGVDSFDAILPPGTGAILAVGGSKPTVVATDDGMIGVRKVMQASLGGPEGAEADPNGLCVCVCLPACVRAWCIWGQEGGDTCRGPVRVRPVGGRGAACAPLAF